jgi:hypothetical protein
MTVLVNLHEHTTLNTILNVVLDGFGHVVLNGKEGKNKTDLQFHCSVDKCFKMRLPLF